MRKLLDFLIGLFITGIFICILLSWIIFPACVILYLMGVI